MRTILALLLLTLGLAAAENTTADLKAQIAVMATTFASDDPAVIKQAIAAYAPPNQDGQAMTLPDEAIAHFMNGGKRAYLVTVLGSLASLEPTVAEDGLAYTFAIDPAVIQGSKRNIIFRYDAAAQVFRLQN